MRAKLLAISGMLVLNQINIECRTSQEHELQVLWSLQGTTREFNINEQTRVDGSVTRGTAY